MIADITFPLMKRYIAAGTQIIVDPNAGIKARIATINDHNNGFGILNILKPIKDTKNCRIATTNNPKNIPFMISSVPLNNLVF